MVLLCFPTTFLHLLPLFIAFTWQYNCDITILPLMSSTYVLGQLREIGSLIDAGIIRPVVDRVFPFAETKEALAYVETGRAKGKVVVKVR